MSSRADAPPYSDDASVLGSFKSLRRCSAAKQLDYERIVAAAEASDAILAVGCITHFAPAIEWATAKLRAGLLGDVRSFDITWGQALDSFSSSQLESHFTHFGNPPAIPSDQMML